MRHDFTLLCTEVIELPDQNNVQIRCPITAIRLTPEVQELPHGGIVPLSPKLYLISQWEADLPGDQRVHDGKFQEMPPDSEVPSREDPVRFDLTTSPSFIWVRKVTQIIYAGPGTYEYHVVLDGVATVGEWGRACLKLY
ncbi:MAG: hypothetical protein OXE52_01580 [Chloroflexi bacterium]|nr:hypothetical protein [Chloroflexota bacterium]